MNPFNRRIRMFLVVSVGLVIWGFLFISLARIQILNHQEYSSRAERQHTCRVEVPCNRGKILDRNGILLAGTLSSPSLFANPLQIKKIRHTSSVLEKYLSDGSRVIQRRLSRGGSFVWLERKVSPETRDLVMAENLRGIYSIPEKDRIRPIGSLARRIVGITNVDNVGIEGIEKEFDSVLSGAPGWKVLQCVPDRRNRSMSGFPTQAPCTGCDVVLTLDASVQSVVELELERAVEKTGACWGMVMSMDPASGEVLAIASVMPSEEGTPSLMNRCVSAQFEPGSTYKLITYAAALEERVVTPDDRFSAGNGKMSFGRYTIHDVKEYDSLTVREAFEYSSNVVTAQIALKMGKEMLYSYSRDFGFGSKTGITLPGELSGILRRPCDWSGRSLPTIAMGHEIAVNLVQMVTAYSAIANDGVLMEPHVVREIRDPDGGVVKSFPPVVVRRVVSSETAATMREFLGGVVEHGTGTAADLKSWPTGGKSGTAQMLDSGGGFSNSRFTSSFIGFVPVGKPRLVTAVVLVDLSGVFYGGVVAGPVFRDIMMKVACSELAEPLRGVLRREAVGQWLLAGEEITEREDEPLLQTEEDANVMPNVRGLGLREAKRILLRSGLAVRCVGGGVVLSQDPPPGRGIVPGTHTTLSGSES